MNQSFKDYEVIVINDAAKDKPDVVRFQVRETNENKENIEYKEEALSKICNYYFLKR